MGQSFARSKESFASNLTSHETRIQSADSEATKLRLMTAPNPPRPRMTKVRHPEPYSVNDKHAHGPRELENSEHMDRVGSTDK